MMRFTKKRYGQLWTVIFFFLFIACDDNYSNNKVTTESSNAILIANQAITAQHIVDRIKETVTCEWREKTVDTFKAGNPKSAVTGIASTFLCNMDVLKKAKAKGLNFIITHEPTFYNHFDETSQYGDDPVLKEKQKYIEDNGMIVWRFHDHWHYTEPDGIYEGMMNQLGWKNNRTAKDAFVFSFPEKTLNDLAIELKRQWNSQTIRVIGDPNMVFTNLAFAAGAPGSMHQINLLQRNDVEVLVGGEGQEWETVEYVRDAISQGRKKALILTGHANSEEAGMAYFVEWMKKIVTEVPVELVEAGDPFWVPQ